MKILLSRINKELSQTERDKQPNRQRNNLQKNKSKQPINIKRSSIL